MKTNKLTGMLLTMFAAVSLYEASAQPITLTGTSYTNTFDNIEAQGYPDLEWSTYTAATATAPGTIATWGLVNSVAGSNSWRTTSGRFANQAGSYSYGSPPPANSGATNFLGTEGTLIQTNEPNRCLAVRQITATDTGVAFVLKLADTLGRKDFVLYLDSMSLDATSPRTTTWTVDYGFGTSPNSFVPVTTFTTGGSTWSTTRRTITLPNGTVDNNAGPVWIRIVVLSPTSGSGNRTTTGVDNAGLTWAMGVACTPANVTSDPANFSGYVNGTASFTCGAVGTAPRYYQWIKNATTALTDDFRITGTTGPTLSIASLEAGDAGTYACIVSNVCDSTLYTDTSAGATLTVSTPPAVSISYLRTLVDPTTWSPTNTTLLYTATGMITTYTNTTTGNTASYYLQDGTGGINLFCTFGSSFRPAIGDVVRAVGFLSTFGGNLELLVNLSNPAQSVTVLSNNIAGYPTPIAVPWDNLFQWGTNANLNYNLAGSIVVVSNVYFGTNDGFVTAVANYNFIVTNAAGQSVRVYVPAQLDNDLTNRTIPAFASSVRGPLIASSSGAYQVMPTLWSDIVPGTPPVQTSPVTITGITTTAINYTGGAGAQFVLYESTDVAKPLNQWTRTTQINTATPGSFTIATSGTQKYYRVKSE